MTNTGNQTDDLTPEEERALRASCARSLAWHGARDAASYLGEVPPETPTVAAQWMPRKA